MEIVETDRYSRWFRRLRDLRARASILARVRRLSLGHPGDWRNVGEGLWELRIHIGRGYRVYYTVVREQLVILLAGGDKSSQDRDIRIAKELARRLEERSREH